MLIVLIVIIKINLSNQKVKLNDNGKEANYMSKYVYSAAAYLLMFLAVHENILQPLGLSFNLPHPPVNTLPWF